MGNELKSSECYREPTFYVGIGASAGGLEALEHFFLNMPIGSGMAFIVIQHLSPDYKSLMTEILSKKTDLPVFQAKEGMLVEADTIYLIPPKMNLRIFNRKLTLSEQSQRGVNYPIDLFFASLAEDQGRKTVGIVLSGTGSDGTRGLRQIKEAAGLTLVQEAESAGFDGMPKSAISAGLGDFILPPQEMPEKLLSYANHPLKTLQKKSKEEILPQHDDALTRLFARLREQHGIDFSNYKPATVLRRIERRITINQVRSIDEYLQHIDKHPTEISALYRELLIGVTNFFRDNEAFKRLTDVEIPELLQSIPSEEIRVWTAGCSTGEEAYSIAILFLEALESLGLKKDVKIFATDVDKEAIIAASTGIYPESIVADIPKKLLEKYFIHKNGKYQVNRKLRELIVFAQHNLIKDPPFTNIHLISCRNLLIYLQPVLQKKIIELFNFALVPQGVLFLGSSETVGDATEYFETLDKKWKILKSKGIKRLVDKDRQSMLFDLSRSLSLQTGRSNNITQLQDYAYVRMLESFLNVIAENYEFLGIIINSSHEVLHIIGDSARFLKIPSGKMQSDIIKLLHPDLAVPTATGIQKVLSNESPINFSGIQVREKNEKIPVKIKISPVSQKRGRENLLSIFIERNKDYSLEKDEKSYDLDEAAEHRIYDLEQQLQFNKESLQATVEELETSNEELQATNEELFASNEELQSTNEELQSVNEELFTVNAELQEKINELTESNNDLDNLLSSIRMATIYLDENLDVRRYTPEATQIFKIIPNDMGRPFSHLVDSLVNIDLSILVERCQKNNHEIDRQVKTKEGHEYLLRILPYQVGEDSYAGVILSFIDLSILNNDTLRCVDEKQPQ